MFGINKNGTKHKIGIIMPAFFPASRTTYDPTTSGLSATRVQGAIDEMNEIDNVTVTVGSGTDVVLDLFKKNGIVSAHLLMGTFTGAANSTLIQLPSGYYPIKTVDFRDTYGNKRISGGSYGREREMYCPEALSNTPIRGTFCYICK